MRKNTFTAAIPVAVIALGLTLAGCSSTPGSDMPSKAPMSQGGDSGSTPTADPMTGSFEGLNGKTVSGTASVEDGELTLSGFSSDEGPDLHVYLTTGTDEAAVGAGKEIDAVAFDKQSQTFMLAGIDTSMYSYVVIHCDKAKAVFGAAKLS
jgi:hypothetical protein